ncbi:MAG: helix-turn-helix domain-containing protein [Myxococcaceae bacterium]
MRPDTRGRGVLEEVKARGVYRALRVLPPEDLADHVDYFWLVRWSLSEPFEQNVLALPAAHFVFERNDVTKRCESRFAGPGRNRFTRVLEGAGHILGVAFHPGTAFAWVRRPLAPLADRLVSLQSVWPHEVTVAERAILSRRSDAQAVEAAIKYLRRWLPPLDEPNSHARRLVNRIATDPSLCRVEQLVNQSGVSERGLQRLFHRYVGVNPKAVIRRFRLVEAAEILEKPVRLRLTELAQRLGYFDQSHFIRDFRATVGRTPSEHRRRALR